MSEKNPSENLKILVNFILKVYGPTWFEVKSQKSCTDGSKNLYNMIQRCRYLKGKVREVVEKSVQHNGFFAHHENILLAMLFDEEEQVREKAIDWIGEAEASVQPRQFKVPKINFKAKGFVEMVDWSNTSITVPPLVSKVKFEDLKNIKHSIIGRQIVNIPCHSQAVERAVKLVTEASKAVTQANRHGFILSRIKSRSMMPKVNSKKDFILE